MFRRTLLPATALLATLGIAGCAMPSGTEDSSSGAQSTKAHTPAKTKNPAPPIPQPKNLRAVNDPCSLITEQQIRQLGETATPEPTEAGWDGPACKWSGDQFAVSVVPNTRFDTGPDRMYAVAKSAGDFQPTTVQGYPALHKNNQSLLCRTEVAVSKDSSFSVDFTRFGGDAPAMQDSCGYADKIAGVVLGNIPEI